MSQPSRAAESGADSVDIKWGQLDLSAHFKLQTLLICEAIVCGSEPAQCTVGDDVQPGQMAISGQKPSFAHLLVPHAPLRTA